MVSGYVQHFVFTLTYLLVGAYFYWS